MKPLFPIIRTGIGKCKHRFLPPDSNKLCVIGGVIFEELPGFQGMADGDVVLYALCHAITSLTGIDILHIAEDLCACDGIIDSAVYVKKGLEALGNQKISHIAIALEAQKPHFRKDISKIRSHLAKLLMIDKSQIGITAISGDGLSDVGCGEGVACEVILTTYTQ